MSITEPGGNDQCIGFTTASLVKEHNLVVQNTVASPCMRQISSSVTLDILE